MIKEPRHFLFSLLAKTLNPILEISIPEAVDYPLLYKTAVSHGISGLIYYPLKDLPVSDKIVLKQFEQDCVQTVVRSSEQQYQLKIVIEALTLHSINHVLMKGEVLRRIYPYPDMRQMGDVDILVNGDDLPLIHLLMKNIGFHFVSESENHHVFFKSSLMIEFHQKLMTAKNQVFDDFFQTAFEHTEKLQESTYQFTYEYHLVYLIAHIAKHFKSQGSGIRSVFDIAVYINTYDFLIDYTLVGEYLDVIKLRQFFETILSLVKEWFHIESRTYEISSEINPDTLGDLTEFIVRCGTYGYSEEHRGDAVSIGIEAKTKNQSIQKGRIAYIMRLAFPKPSALKYKYKYLEKYPYLVPIAWINRFFNLIFKRKNKKRRIKNVFTKDQDIKKMMKLYKEIGLL